MKQRTAIKTILGNKQAVALLLHFTKYPRTELSYTQIRSKTKLAKATLTKWLATLAAHNIINIKKIGTTKLYRTDKENSFVKQFKILHTIDSLQFLKAIGQKLEVEIYLFGSAARGEDHEGSDMDILTIGKIKREELLHDIQKYKKAENLHLQFQIFTPLEWSTLAHKDKAFYERVEKDKITLT